MSFVHLHCHSEYSLLDGANRIDDLIARAQEFEQPALAITDHGNMHAAWEFQEKAKKAGIKPIIGMEAYVAPGDRRARGRAGARTPSRTTTSCCSPATSIGLPEPRQALVARLHRRLLRASRASTASCSRSTAKGSSSPRRAWPAKSRTHLLDGPRRRGARSGRVVRRTSSRTATTSRCRRTTREGQAKLNDAGLHARRRARPAGRRDQRRALPASTTTTTRTTCCSASGSARIAATATACATTTGCTSRAHREIAERFPGPPRRPREHAADRRRSATSQFAKKYHVPSFPLPAGVDERERAARAARDRGREGALRRSAAAERAGAARLRARRHHEDGLRRLLPHRRRLHPGGARSRHSRRARAAARPPARSSRTRSASPTSARSSSTCCSSAS